MFAQRLAQVSESATMKVAAEAERLRRAGHDVVDFSVGEPDFPTPDHIKEAGKAAIDANFTRYTAVAGIPELREAICARYKADYGVSITPAEVLLTVGGKQALFNAALALMDPGDEVITHAPYWPTIPEQVKLVGATPVIVPTNWQDGFAVHADAMLAAITPRTKAIIINSPANPTGALVDESAVAAIADAAAKRGIWIIVDLCYEHLIYEDVPHNLPKVLFDRHRDRTVLACSASKAYSMTGWRCGWTIASKELTRVFNTIEGQTTSNITSVTQKAALAAVGGSQEPVKVFRDEFRRRRDNLHAWLTANPGIQCVKPKGAFYLFPNVTGLLTDAVKTSAEFAQALLEKEHVVVTPGEAFDAPGYVRISYATSMERLREGADRILRFADTLQPEKGERVTLITASVAASLREAVGRDHVLEQAQALEPYAADALGIGSPPDLVVIPGTTREIAAVARLCNEHRVPLVVRGAGTGYTGGAVPTRGGVVLSMERLNRILEIDQSNLLAVVEPNVITGDLQRAVEAVGLFYPPDPASLDSSSIGGNVAECAGGPRAFKYGTTKRYVLALEAVLPTGEIVRTGSKAVKNVVGYDLTQLLVGSEGTLAIITQVTLRLIPKPPARATLSAAFSGIRGAVDAVSALLQRRVVPAAIELIDADSLRAAETYAGRTLTKGDALLIVECDGAPAAVSDEVDRVEGACRDAGAIEVTRAASDAERDALWTVRRQVSLALRATGLLKINHDVVVPRGRVPELFDVVAGIRSRYRLRIASFGHAGDGNIHVNLMIDRSDAAQLARAKEAERVLFEQVVALEGSISGEHGIGFAKAPYLAIELAPDQIALMQRVKAAFDPNNILNPGKIFPQ